MENPNSTDDIGAPMSDDIGPEREGPFERLERLVGGGIEISPSQPAGGVVIGELAGFDPSGAPLVCFGGRARAVRALALKILDETWIGRALALQFVADDPARPVILGPLVEPELTQEPTPEQTQEPTQEDGVEELCAERKLTLRCGEASLTLTHDGKVLIRGTYVSSRSSGMQRIRGGTVCIN